MLNVYNLDTGTTTPMKHPGDIIAGDCWILTSTKLVICFRCRKYIEPQKEYLVYCPSGNLIHSETYHLGCGNDRMLEAIAEHMDIELS